MRYGPHPKKLKPASANAAQGANDTPATAPTPLLATAGVQNGNAAVSDALQIDAWAALAEPPVATGAVRTPVAIAEVESAHLCARYDEVVHDARWLQVHLTVADVAKAARDGR